MHKKQHHERHLGESDQQGKKRICSGEDAVQIPKGRKISEDRPDDEDRENAQIAGIANMPFVVIISHILLRMQEMPPQQI